MSDLVRCQEPVDDGVCNDFCQPDLKAADGSWRCLRHRPVEAPKAIAEGPVEE